MRAFNAPKQLLKKGKGMVSALRQLSRLINDPELSQSYYPSEERKSKARITADLLLWLLRYRNVDTLYYVHGFDRRHGVNKADYLPWRTFRKLQDAKNLHPKGSEGYNYICLLKDKFVFSQFVRSLGFPTPKNLAICNRESLTWLSDMRTLPLEALLQEEVVFDGFCKPLAGRQGQGAFPLSARGGKLFSDGEEISLEHFKRLLKEQSLIQERVQQHPKMSELHSHSLNTIRLVTFNREGAVEPLLALLRVGANGKTVDNWSVGGILLDIDMASGRVRGDGVLKPGYGARISEHPQTHVAFDGFEIPCFHEGVELAMKLHEYFYGIYSIGWDLAISKAGPTIIEGNDRWDGASLTILDENYTRRFLELQRS